MAQKEIDNTQKVVDNVFSSIQSRLEEALCEEDDTNVRIRVQAVLESKPEKMDTVNGHFRCTKSAFNAVTKRLRSVSRPRPAVLPPAGEATPSKVMRSSTLGRQFSFDSTPDKKKLMQLKAEVSVMCCYEQLPWSDKFGLKMNQLNVIHGVCT